MDRYYGCTLLLYLPGDENTPLEHTIFSCFSERVGACESRITGRFTATESTFSPC